jgi:hypothetical protein
MLVMRKSPSIFIIWLCECMLTEVVDGEGGGDTTGRLYVRKWSKFPLCTTQSTATP